jgi:hypothetical protein
MNAAIPNPRMINPEMRFIQRRTMRLIRFRSRLVTPLRSTHQHADPKKTPRTVTAAVEKPPPTFTRPKPANMAAKDKIVSGLVRVSKNVEPYALNKLFWLAVEREREGCERKVLMPIKQRNAPPIKRNKICCWSRKLEIKVKPNAAILPYRASAVAAPTPDRNPIILPEDKVRFMQRIPIGPTGAAIEKPMIKPLYKLLISTDDLKK